MLQRAGLVAGASAVPASWPLSGYGQSDETVTTRLREDFQTHASFGLKHSCGPGDNATADWTASRLRSLGYRVDVSEFDAPFFDDRRSELRVGDVVVDIVPQAPVIPTDALGFHAPLALIEEGDAVPDLFGRIAVIVAPFARHAALFPVVRAHQATIARLAGA